MCRYGLSVRGRSIWAVLLLLEVWLAASIPFCAFVSAAVDRCLVSAWQAACRPRHRRCAGREAGWLAVESKNVPPVPAAAATDAGAARLPNGVPADVSYIGLILRQDLGRVDYLRICCIPPTVTPCPENAWLLLPCCVEGFEKEGWPPKPAPWLYCTVADWIMVTTNQY